MEHNAPVRGAAAKERVLRWTPSQTWDPQREYLGAPVPNEPFPRGNTTETYQRKLDAMMVSSIEKVMRNRALASAVLLAGPGCAYSRLVHGA